MTSLLDGHMILSTVLSSIAVLIAFGPELRHSLTRIRASERAVTTEPTDTPAR